MLSPISTSATPASAFASSAADSRCFSASVHHLRTWCRCRSRSSVSSSGSILTPTSDFTSTFSSFLITAVRALNSRAAEASLPSGSKHIQLLSKKLTTFLTDSPDERPSTIQAHSSPLSQKAFVTGLNSHPSLSERTMQNPCSGLATLDGKLPLVKRTLSTLRTWRKAAFNSPNNLGGTMTDSLTRKLGFLYQNSSNAPRTELQSRAKGHSSNDFSQAEADTT